MKRDILNSPRLLELKRKKRKIFFRKILFWVSGLLVILIGLSYLSRINKLNISDVEITGNKVVDTEMMKTSVEKEIAGNYLWIFPKTNIFFYPQNTIQKVLHEKFKRLKNISLSIKDRKTLAISVTERIPQYTWCGTSSPITGTDNPTCYFLDDTGYVFDEAPYFSGDVYFKFYGSTSLVADNPSGSYFAGVNFGKLISFEKTLGMMGLKPIALYMMDDGNITIYLSSASSSSTKPEILFKIDSDFQKIAENLQAALTTEPLQTDFKKKYSSLLYIDLRFGNKVFYKFK